MLLKKLEDNVLELGGLCRVDGHGFLLVGGKALVEEVAGDDMAGLGLELLGLLGEAYLHALRAAGMEAAALRRIGRAWYIALKDALILDATRSDFGNHVEELSLIHI